MMITLLDEPPLEFRYGQLLDDPHRGLTLFGPPDTDAPGHPGRIGYAVVGPPEGVDRFHTFANALAFPIVGKREKPRDPLLWPTFPGIEAAFATNFSTTPIATQVVGREALHTAAQLSDPNQRAYRVVDAYLHGIQRLAERDDPIDVIICVVPDFVWENCRPQSTLDSTGETISTQERLIRQQQPDLFGSYRPEEYQYSVDFRRQLKARAMPIQIPLQIILESTLNIAPTAREVTPLSDRAWNLSTTLYYKAGGKPWRLATARPGVCYVGIAFRRVDQTDEGSTSACCAAQMFLDTGDGIIFRGEYGPWYSPERKAFHLDRRSASTLLEGVLNTYQQQGGKDLKEIFLHSRSSINVDEFAGYRDACPPGTNLAGIRVRSERRGLRAYRDKKYPVLRGMLWKVDDRRAYLWAAGFKPSLLTYDGWEVPAPVRIDIQHGTADLNQVATDILGLTKLNYNACRLGDSEPVTIRFSDMVGEILTANPATAAARPNFKYYI
jgi:hypothetical protein